MKTKKTPCALPHGSKLQAGEFGEWLCATELSLDSGVGTSGVPCGTCTACCRSSMFVQIAPAETQTLQRIPRNLLFPAPGLPRGHRVLGYNDEGHCPMLADGKCSIYEHRPRTCRAYDCRIFAATGISPVDPAQADIAARVRQWEFTYADEATRKTHESLQAAASFLRSKKDLFAPGTLPEQPARLAVLAIKVCRVLDKNASDAETSRAIATRF